MADIEMTDMAPPKQQQLQAEQSVGQKRKAEDHLSSSPAPASHCAPASPARVASLPSVVGQPASAGSGGSSDKENKPAQKKAKLDEGGKGKDKEKEAAVGVELTKGGKWSVKQKVVELCDVSNAVKKDVITLTDELEALTEPLQAFSEAQLLVVARLVHESDKTLPELARHLRAKLVPQAVFDEDSQGSNSGFDRLPVDALKAAISQVATRTNYGIEDDEVAWLPSPVPNALKFWRWEAHNPQTVLPLELRDKMVKRQQDRVKIKSTCLDILSALSPQDRDDLVAKVSKTKKKDGDKTMKPVTATASMPIVVDDDEAETTPVSSAQKGKAKESGSGKSKEERQAEKEARAKEKEERQAEKEARAKEKEEKQKEKEEKQKEREEKKEAKAAEQAQKKEEQAQKKAEAAQKKADKDAKKKAKEDAEIAKRKETAKMDLRNFFGGGGSAAEGDSSAVQSSASPEASRKTTTFATPSTPASANAVVIGSSPANSAAGSQGRRGSEDQGTSGGQKKSKKLSDFERAFRPFTVRSAVVLAPVNRFAKEHEADVDLDGEPGLTREDSLRDFLRRVPEYRRPVGVRRVVPAVTARKVVQELAECDMAGDVEGSRSWRALLGNRQKLAIKVFKFAEDVRPGYVGTWTKQTRSVRPRKPFGKDTCLLNYEYDSEGDWEEEEEEGEDLEEEEDEEGEAMSEVDSEDGGWLVDDDEPVEGEGDESMELDDDIMFVGATGELAAVSEARRKKALEKKRSATKEGAKKRKLVGPLVPIVKGPLWEKELGQVESETLQPFRIQFLNDARIGLDPFTFVPETTNSILGIVAQPARATALAAPPSAPPVASGSGSPVAGPSEPNQLQPRKKEKSAGFPAALMPKLIGMVDGTKRAKHLLVEDLKGALQSEQVKVTKVAIEKALVDSADKVQGGVWKVKDEVKAQFAA